MPMLAAHCAGRLFRGTIPVPVVLVTHLGPCSLHRIDLWTITAVGRTLCGHPLLTSSSTVGQHAALQNTETPNYQQCIQYSSSCLMSKDKYSGGSTSLIVKQTEALQQQAALTCGKAPARTICLQGSGDTHATSSKVQVKPSARSDLTNTWTLIGYQSKFKHFFKDESLPPPSTRIVACDQLLHAADHSTPPHRMA
jgi:hypothetical protein